MGDVEQIARGLTKAQRELVLALSPDCARDWKSLSRNVNTRDKLARLGLVSFDDRGPVVLYCMRKLTPLGQQVRAYLMQEPAQ